MRVNSTNQTNIVSSFSQTDRISDRPKEERTLLVDAVWRFLSVLVSNRKRLLSRLYLPDFYTFTPLFTRFLLIFTESLFVDHWNCVVNNIWYSSLFFIALLDESSNTFYFKLLITTKSVRLNRWSIYAFNLYYCAVNLLLIQDAYNRCEGVWLCAEHLIKTN